MACGPHDCTLIGGLNGVAVQIPAALYVSSGDVTLEVCDTHDCASTTQVMAELPASAPRPTERMATASFHSLGRTFAPGEVTVTVSLHGPHGALVAKRLQPVRLEHRYPNGKDCDDGFVGGSLSMESGDRV